MDIPESLDRLRALLEPSLAVPLLQEAEPFLQYSTCAGLDFLHPRYHTICRMLQCPVTWHRKHWEWVFIIHHLLDAGMLRPGSRGLGFGVGQEGGTVLYRARDLEQLVEELRADGHDADPFRVSPYGHHLDGHVDLPPYSSPHLKLAFAGYVCTSAGIVVRRAP